MLKDSCAVVCVKQLAAIQSCGLLLCESDPGSVSDDDLVAFLDES